MGTRDKDQITFTVVEAAKFLNTSRATVYRLLQKGILKRVKEPGVRAWKVPLESLETYDIASKLTLEELATKLVSLERKVDFLLTQNVGPKNAPKTVAVDYAKLHAAIRKRHPGYSN